MYVVVQDEHIVNRAESVVELHPERSEIAGTVVLEVRDRDRIGLADVAPRDEYDTYVGGVYRLLASGATAEQIAEHLVRIERAAMGYDQATIWDLLPIARTLQAVDLRLGDSQRAPY